MCRQSCFLIIIIWKFRTTDRFVFRNLYYVISVAVLDFVKLGEKNYRKYLKCVPVGFLVQRFF